MGRIMRWFRKRFKRHGFPKGFRNKWMGFCAFNSKKHPEGWTEDYRYSIIDGVRYEWVFPYWGCDSRGEYVQYHGGDIVPLIQNLFFVGYYRVVTWNRNRGDNAGWDDGKHYDFEFDHIAVPPKPTDTGKKEGV